MQCRFSDFAAGHLPIYHEVLRAITPLFAFLARLDVDG